jgi:hypothetical protein
MANWKKVIVSGSSAELAALQVDNLSSGVVTGASGNLTTTPINGSGDIVATTAASGLSHSGSFSGSFQGNFVGIADLPDLTQGAGISSFTYDGSTTATVAVSGAANLTTNNITKWTGDAFAPSSLDDNGTVVSGTSSIQLSGASSSLTGSFTGSFSGDGSGLTGLPTVLNTSGSTGNGSVDLLTQTLSILGTANEIETSASGQSITIGLPDDVTITGDLVVQQNLTVFGTASFQQTTNLEVADRFVLFASGSNTTGDGGIVVQQGTQNVGELFGYDSATVRWGVTSSFSADQGSFTPDAFMAVASIGTANDPTAIDSRYQAKGNLFIGLDEGIWIYS